MHLVFAHGSGQVGRDAFPQQATAFPDAEFPVLAGYGDDGPTVGDVAVAAQSLAMRGAEADGVVGVGYGGVIAAMAACMEQPAALVLIEPALFQLARGRPATAALIERVEPLYLDAARSDEDFGQCLVHELEDWDPTARVSPDGLRWSRRSRLHGAPWRHPIDTGCLAETPMLVLTGGWRTEFEEVAAALVELGAQHEVLGGDGHRVTEHPACSERIRAFVESV
ncbi:alpha/beta fold hydrolase [Agrococcus sp. ProA11]|uniref:alpha/beta fold hydrolase n=1 Tax=Agrococcus chionoecetis TaxID=3153752 RepID=UPI003260A438